MACTRTGVLTLEALTSRTAVLLLASGAFACSGNDIARGERVTQPPSARPETKDSIEGLWRLVQFDSRDPLDPPLEGFVAGELGHLEVWLQKGRLYATGELVDGVCDYSVDEFDGRAFSLTLKSEATWSTVSGRLDGDDVYFDALDVPWVGSGRFIRQGP